MVIAISVLATFVVTCAIWVVGVLVYCYKTKRRFDHFTVL